ncbi:MAG: hypothetical protein ACFE94_02945 [Candidatus Hodarchaeota archaeon]
MSDKELAYDIRLEISRDEILKKLWVLEEIQLQPPQIRETIIKNFNKINV